MYTKDKAQKQHDNLGLETYTIKKREYKLKDICWDECGGESILFWRDRIWWSLNQVCSLWNNPLRKVWTNVIKDSIKNSRNNNRR